MADDVPPPPLAVTIRDAVLAAWLRAAPDADRAAEDTLRVGKVVLDATRVTVAPASSLLDQALAPLAGRLGALQASLDTMLRTGGANSASQARGVVGEQLVLTQLRNAFPLDTFDCVATTAHAADIVGRVAVGDGVKEVRIEVKNYAHTVPTAEFGKFRADLRTSGAPLGLFVSLASGVAGVRGRMAVRTDGGDAIVVTVPNAGVDGTGALWGLLMLKTLAGATDMRNVDMDAAYAAVVAGTEEVAALGKEAAALEASLAAAAAAVDAARWKAVEWKRRVAAAERRLVAAAARALPNNEESVDEDVDGKVRPYLAALDEAAKAAGATVRRAGDAWIVERAGSEQARATGKRKLNIAFEAVGGEARVEVGVEDVRGTQIVVNGDASVAKWGAAVKKRLGQQSGPGAGAGAAV